MTLTEIQQALAALDTRPRQSLGQNFLHDQNLARWIVARLGLQAGDHVVEIGPGLGALTEQLLSEDVTVTLIEKDRSMVAWLTEKFRDPRVELFHMDALDFDLRNLYGKGPVKIIGNLPYYVSTPLIAKFSSALSPASILVLTLQHEVAARLHAQPGTKDFGAMSVCSSRRWNVRYVKKLPATVFFPRPKVSSAVVVFERKAADTIPPCDEAVFESLVRRGFSERRKQLRNLLPELKDRWPSLCAHLALPETVRAEELSLAAWETFTQYVNPVAAQSGEEMFDIVDENDSVVETRPRDAVHVNNLRHRAVHILITNEKGELFLQKRSIWKDKNPGCWDSSAAGHVDAGESYEDAARRELAEEIGIDCPVERIGRLPCSAGTGWEFIEVFHGRHEGPFRLAALEVETGAFFPVTQIHTWLDRAPADFSPVFVQCLPFLGGTRAVGSQADPNL
ncbi:MAG: 16S rRNA (adenine(1518)-N(6)/adenine(1519)-N(6))-dimethyltransferase RsmA [Terrimicrobiaceae bacterium]